MSVASFLVFLVPALIGSLLIHLLWPERKSSALVLKGSLGVGAGLGISSILYFLSLLIAPGQVNMMAVLILFLIILLFVTILRERRGNWKLARIPHLSGLQRVLLAVTFVAFVISVLTFLSLMRSRPQGAFDAWSIWNRAARFIYRDPENWQATLSPDLFSGMHADYPLLVPLNVAWGWETLGAETLRIPMMQGAFFLFACIGLMFAAVGLLRSSGQASLASLLLMSTPTFLLTGSGLISDVPVAFFIFAASVLIYLYFVFRNPALLVLSGFMAGLGAWTKNEGLLFVAVSVPVLILASRKEILRCLPWYLAGLAVPMIVVLYFKIALAPPSELLTDNEGQMSAKLMDLSRYWMILDALRIQILAFPGWPFSIFFQLAIYALIMRFNLLSQPARGIQSMIGILLLQLLGYCAIYVLTPYDLGWHLGTSFGRLILHIYPTAVFLFFCVVSEPERYFPTLINSGKM